MTTYTKTLLALAGLILMTSFSVHAQKGQGDLTGVSRQGITPSIDTRIGKLDHIKIGPCENTTGHAYIGTHLFLKTGDDDQLLNIHLGAAYAVESFVKNLETGQLVEVLVFRTEQMEENHFIANEVTVNGKTLRLRDVNLRPIWAGDRGQQRFRRLDYRRRGRY